MRVHLFYVEVSGRTYPIREELKAIGLRWDGSKKLWKGRVTEEELEKLRMLANKFQIEIETEDEEEYGYTRRYRRDTNYAWVRCWECGRLVPPGKATWDGNGWYCGC